MNSEQILKALGAKRHGRGWIARCPSHNDHNPSLSIAERDGKLLLKCRAGCSQDDVVAALRARGLWEARGGGSGADGGATLPDPASTPQKDPMQSWRNASPLIHGTAVDRYLRSRAILITVEEAQSLRFVSGLWHWPTQSKWPSMVARVSLATGADLTTHQTFLKLDGSGKAPLGEKARLFAAGGHTLGGGVWIGEPDPSQEFIVGEGIESTLSAMRIFGAGAGCAALSEGGIRRLILPPDAARVRVFADHDELGQGLSAAGEACRRWRAEGREVAISIADRVGEDANDVLKRRTA